ncbi:MAG TPA: hypothetical protein VFQ53_14930 [Kofleriaceae bacterium]|nr:hypothetical protein [Kofleriaceae bacterium]
MSSHAGRSTFQCINCRLAQRAEVRGAKSTGSRARGAPRIDANTPVAMLLALKRCPRCGYFDRGVAAHNRHTVRVGIVLWGSLLAAVATALLLIPGVPRVIAAIIAGMLAIAFVALIRHLRNRYPQSVESRVVLLESIPVNDGWY